MVQRSRRQRPRREPAPLIPAAARQVHVGTPNKKRRRPSCNPRSASQLAKQCSFIVAVVLARRLVEAREAATTAVVQRASAPGLGSAADASVPAAASACRSSSSDVLIPASPASGRAPSAAARSACPAAAGISYPPWHRLNLAQSSAQW